MKKPTHSVDTVITNEDLLIKIGQHLSLSALSVFAKSHQKAHQISRLELQK